MSLSNTHVLISSNAIDLSSGKDVMNVSQMRKGQDVKHVTLVIGMMEMAIVFYVPQMSVVPRIIQGLLVRIAHHVNQTSLNVLLVCLVISLYQEHVSNVVNMNVVDQQITRR